MCLELEGIPFRNLNHLVFGKLTASLETLFILMDYLKEQKTLEEVPFATASNTQGSLKAMESDSDKSAVEAVDAAHMLKRGPQAPYSCTVAND